MAIAIEVEGQKWAAQERELRDKAAGSYRSWRGGGGIWHQEAVAAGYSVIDELVTAAWKLKTLIRTRRFCTDAELVILCKFQIVSFLEYRTESPYHLQCEGRRIDSIGSDASGSDC